MRALVPEAGGGIAVVKCPPVVGESYLQFSPAKRVWGFGLIGATCGSGELGRNEFHEVSRQFARRLFVLDFGYPSRTYGCKDM